MKVVIFAGGFGTRLGEYTDKIPKPMLDIEGRPLLLHLMDIFSYQGFNEFIISTGYKSHVVKQYFSEEMDRQAVYSFNFVNGQRTYTHKSNRNEWKVTVADTGLNSMTGGRLLGVKEFVKDEPFFCTYGDGLANVDLRNLMKAHSEGQYVATLTAVHPKPRFGLIQLSECGKKVCAFNEKGILRKDWVNGGFFVFEPEIFNYIEDCNTVLEKFPLETLACKNMLGAYLHEGYWECCDTKRDLDVLRRDAQMNNVPWLLSP